MIPNVKVAIIMIALSVILREKLPVILALVREKILVESVVERVW
jgi:hypothetical protein